MIEPGLASSTRPLVQVYIGFWGAGTVLLLISLERAFSRRRLFFGLGILCLAVGASLGLLTDWANRLRAAMSIGALVFCATAATVRLLRDRIRSGRRLRELKDAIEHMGPERE